MPDDQNLYSVSDLVTRRTGGPTMTVVELFDDGRYECAWFDGEAVRTESLLGSDLIKAAS